VNQTFAVIAWFASLAACLCVITPLATTAQTTKPTAKFPKAEIKTYHGAPTLFINGEPNAGLTYMTYKPQAKYYEAFGKIGVDLASMSVTADFALFGGSSPATWLGPDQYDYSDMDNKMKMILQANPNAYVLPRVYMSSPPWWDKQHPDQLVKWDDGKVEKDIGRKNTIPSWASEEYRKASADNLRRFIEHVRRQPYADRVIGYHVASGQWEEWFYWRSKTDEFQDYSEPMVHAFRKWLGKKYGSDAALQKAWNKPAVTLASAAIPTRGEREAMDLYIWRDPASRRNVIDYYCFYCENDIEVIRLMAHAVKESTNGEQLCGVFYGYMLHSSRENGQQNNGHLALQKLLQCPDIDFLTAPTSYAFREVGTGYSATQPPTDPVRLHGKYYFDENDVRTHLLPWHAGYGRTADLQDSEALQLRQMGNMVTHAWGAWWFDMGGGWYDEAKFMDILKKLNAIGENSVRFDRSDTAEIAVVIDERSVFYNGLKASVMGPLVYDQVLPLGKMGATFDWVFLDDLDVARPYKFYIFLNAFHVDDAQKQAIDRLKSRGANAFLWMYGAGFAGEKSLDVKGCTDLTGIHIKMEEKFGPLLVKIGREGAGILPALQPDSTYGSHNDIGPLLYPDDPDADVLGVLEGYGVPGLVLKKVNGMDVYYSSGLTVPSAVLRAMASRSGVHIYNYQDDVLYANRSFLSIHTASAGARHIRLPERTDVYDVYNDQVVARNTTRFDVDLPVRRTVLYFLGSEAEWKKLK